MSASSSVRSAGRNEHEAWLEAARRVLATEREALARVEAALDEDFCRAVARILDLDGRLVVVGMGKSGIIAKKIAATFASTGTPAFFVHAAEAQHGDLGMITRQDAVLALSHSGETEEVVRLLPTIKRLGADLIALTGNAASTLARHADMVLHVDVTREACPHNLAPTASTTAALALGDALAVAVLEQRGFSPEDFARFHPAGSLGRRLMRVRDVMHAGKAMPLVGLDAPLREAIVTISAGRLGIVGVIEEGRLVGCLTDGDLRRLMESGRLELERPAGELMHAHPQTIAPDHLAGEAVRLMEERKITQLFVVDDQGRPEGVVHLHDLLQAGVA
ncbi:MAG: KpsF/GutQ family sugar-phosphate isomerase [Planctomycetota bacterium]|nr:MAG: KpsF/GutQ family sugar-phosphate isomerase [Planctomycetota bacterium]